MGDTEIEQQYLGHEIVFRALLSFFLQVRFEVRNRGPLGREKPQEAKAHLTSMYRCMHLLLVEGGLEK